MAAGLLQLEDARSRLLVLPAKGAAIARFDALVEGRGPVPLLRPWDGSGALACELLVPWSNRISGGGFTFDGRFHAVAPNVPGEVFPIHGDGFQKPWRVCRQTPVEVELVLEHGAIGPYRYAATVTYRLDGGRLAATLTVENRASMRLPYGLGFHPWLPRRAGTLLEAKAERVWLEDDRHLPVGTAPVDANPAWDFSRPAALPAGWINNGFDGWNRRASIVQPEDGIVLSLQASPLLDVYMLYSPAADAGFFCFEPVSHPVDAHNLGGLTPLAFAESMSAGISLGWSGIG